MKKSQLRQKILKILSQNNSISEFPDCSGRVFVPTNTPNWTIEEMTDKIIELVQYQKENFHEKLKTKN